jgi:hypothetical protein
MQQTHKLHPLVQLRVKYQGRFDALAMFFYLSVVHVWSLTVYPLGRDYTAMASGGEGLPPIARELFALEMRLFGSAVAPYHLVNLALLYGSMLCLYAFVRLGVRGPFWLGTLAATLFMALPVHAESVLNVSGVGELLPCFLALAALAAYAACAAQPGWGRALAAWGLFTLAVAPFPGNSALILVILLYEALLTPPGRKSLLRPVPCVAVGAGAILLHVPRLAEHSFDPADLFSPLYFAFYPIGFMPETSARFAQQPWLGWTAALCVLGVLALVLRKARRADLLFAILAMAAFRLSGSPRPVDPYHLIGGGQLIVPNALFCFGLTALFHRIMDNTRWRITVVGFTTTLCVIFFAMQIRTTFTWREAGEMMRQWRHAAAAEVRDMDGASTSRPNADEGGAHRGLLAVCPDYRHFEGAPLMVSESLSQDTPFGSGVKARGYLPMHAVKGLRIRITEEDGAGLVRGEGVPWLTVAPWPYALLQAGGIHSTAEADYELRETHSDGFTLQIRPRETSWPQRVWVPE